MKRSHPLFILLTVLCLVTVLGCASKKVTRISEDTVTDLSGRWNDTDSRLVSQEMISDCLSSPWKSHHLQENGEKPVVIVGIVQNKSSEHIAIETFIGDIERAFINTGEVTVVASKDEREQIRDERQDQQTYSSEETMKRWGREIGADYMLGGTISSIVDQEKGDRVVFYQVDLTLINLETNAKAWAGQKKIKKYIERAGMSY